MVNIWKKIIVLINKTLAFCACLGDLDTINKFKQGPDQTNTTFHLAVFDHLLHLCSAVIGAVQCCSALFDGDKNVGGGGGIKIAHAQSSHGIVSFQFLWSTA